MNQLEGYCKECGAQVFKRDEIPGYAGIYECPKCNHPHAKNELWDEKPDYIVDQGSEQ